VRLRLALTVGLACCFGAAESRAQVDLSRALEVLRGDQPPRVFADRLGLLTETALPGAVSVGDRWFTVDVAPGALEPLLNAAGGAPLWWSPPRRLLLDRADSWTRAGTVRSETGLSGRGVVVGIVDSGVDPGHPDLCDAEGKTRVRWWLDFSRGPAGRQPELETQYGCDEGLGCAVMSGEDIDELLANAVENDEPRDTFGHGTHVASLAAGSGLSSDPPRYVGVAPEASLIVARVARSGGGGILDADVLKAAGFVFERAQALGMPAVVNMSLGSDFGGHDGSSALELGLSDLVGSEHPGRALVVAAGNSAGLYGVDLGLPSPLGIHTEVHVPQRGEALVPIFTPPPQGDRTAATIYVWIGMQNGDLLNVGLDDEDGEWIEPLAPGRAGVLRKDGIEVTVVNQTDDLGATRGTTGAVLIIDGVWPASRSFTLRLTGTGTANLWLQSEGDLSPEVSPGALVPRAFKEGTINIPASAPDLIAVGATLNRTDWTDYQGNTVSFPQHGVLDDAPPDTTAFFSSAGPNAQGIMKPDLLAPGANVIGAMSRFADPRSAEGGLFSALGRCPADTALECFVTDEGHGVSGGTSMAAPIVAGAIALLFERDPTLDQHQVRALLQAGARPLEGEIFAEQQVGAGALDIERTLLAQLAEDSPAERLPTTSSVMMLAASFARPDPESLLWGLVELRDDAGAPADGFDPQRLRLAVSGGQLAAGLERRAPGLYDFALSAPSGSGGAELAIVLSFDDAPIVSRSVPIAVDHSIAEQGVVARGGCALSPVRRAGGSALLGLGLLLTAWRNRRSRRAARMAPRRDRTGGRG
jgi:subtilisin family serine protease